MKEGMFEEYLTGLFKDVPCYVYDGMIVVFALGAIALFVVKKPKNGWRWIAGLLLLEYVALIYCSTVVFRMSGSETGYNFMPFWSYGAILRDEDCRLLPENVMNVVVFVPVGIILGSLLRVKGSWFIALLFGLGISVSIETLQFFLKRGFAEVDDVMHNTVGCVIGYMLVVIIKQIWLLQKRYWMS